MAQSAGSFYEGQCPSIRVTHRQVVVHVGPHRDDSIGRTTLPEERKDERMVRRLEGCKDNIRGTSNSFAGSLTFLKKVGQEWGSMATRNDVSSAAPAS